MQQMAKRPSKRNTFGWVRMEVLGALVNAVFLVALCFTIVVEALTRLVRPEGAAHVQRMHTHADLERGRAAVEDPRLVLIVGGAGLAVNLIAMALFHGAALSRATGRGML
jgi:solute carrier family 30 (zinc transporter), member 1